MQYFPDVCRGVSKNHCILFMIFNFQVRVWTRIPLLHGKKEKDGKAFKGEEDDQEAKDFQAPIRRLKTAPIRRSESGRFSV